MKFTEPTIQRQWAWRSPTAACGYVAALFPLIAVGTPVRFINVPVKVAWNTGELLLEAHPPVDAEGKSAEPDVEYFSDLLRAAVGETTVATHWEYARKILQQADAVIATVGLEAENPSLSRRSCLALA